MTMLEEILRLYNFIFIRRSKWADIYENNTHVLTVDSETDAIKIKPLQTDERQYKNNKF